METLFFKFKIVSGSSRDTWTTQNKLWNKKQEIVNLNFLFKLKIASGSSSCDTWTTQNKMGFYFGGTSIETIFKLKQEIVNWISCLSLKIVSGSLFAIWTLRKIKMGFYFELGKK